MKKPATHSTERKCAHCKGTGFPKVKQPIQPDRKIYPAPCQRCMGKGRITTPEPKGLTGFSD
jgi:DnaJ-class molecular chaperone